MGLLTGASQWALTGGGGKPQPGARPKTSSGSTNMTGGRPQPGSTPSTQSGYGTISTPSPYQGWAPPPSPASGDASTSAAAAAGNPYPQWSHNAWENYAGGAVDSQFEQDRALADQGLAYLQQKQALAGLQSKNSLAALDQDSAYANQQKGFANQGADLARQLLGLDRQELGVHRDDLNIDRSDLNIDRSDLGINRADYSRDWEYRQWQMNNNLAARGAMVTPGSRFQHEDMFKQLVNQNALFDNQGRRIDNQGRRIDNQGRLLDIEGGRIDVRGNQINLNLAEQLAGYDNRLAQNKISASDQQLADQIMGLGYSQETAQWLLSMASNDAAAAALLAQLLAQGPPGGYQYQAPTKNPDMWR